MIKVFLVEDEIIIRNGIKNSINWEMHGYDFVGEASDGELALPMILEKKPDILITDIKMPFMDGLELSEQVKKVLPATKIMMITHRKLIHGLFHRKRYFRYIPIRKSCTIMRAVPIRVAFSNPVLNFQR